MPVPQQNTGSPTTVEEAREALGDVVVGSGPPPVFGETFDSLPPELVRAYNRVENIRSPEIQECIRSALTSASNTPQGHEELYLYLNYLYERHTGAVEAHLGGGSTGWITPEVTDPRNVGDRRTNLLVPMGFEITYHAPVPKKYQRDELQNSLSALDEISRVLNIRDPENEDERVVANATGTFAGGSRLNLSFMGSEGSGVEFDSHTIAWPPNGEPTDDSIPEPDPDALTLAQQESDHLFGDYSDPDSLVPVPQETVERAAEEMEENELQAETEQNEEMSEQMESPMSVDDVEPIEPSRETIDRATEGLDPARRSEVEQAIRNVYAAGGAPVAEDSGTVRNVIGRPGGVRRVERDVHFYVNKMKKLLDTAGIKTMRVYKDSGCVEIASEVLRTWPKVTKWFSSVDAIARKYRYKPWRRSVSSGGMHVNIGIDRTLPNWRLGYLNFFILVAQHPEINWVFNDPGDNSTANSLPTNMVFMRFLHTIMERNNQDLTTSQLEVIWGHIAKRGLGGRGHALGIRGNRYIEMRTFEMPRSPHEFRDMVEFVNALLKFSIEVGEWGILLPFECDLLTEDTDEIEERGYRLSEQGPLHYPNLMWTAECEFNKLLRGVGLDPKRYRKYVRRNYHRRRSHGVEYML